MGECHEQKEDGRWDVFLSYRAGANSLLAELYEKLNAYKHEDGRPFRIFWDQKSGSSGKNWEKSSAKVCVCVYDLNANTFVLKALYMNTLIFTYRLSSFLPSLPPLPSSLLPDLSLDPYLFPLSFLLSLPISPPLPFLAGAMPINISGASSVKQELLR